MIESAVENKKGKTDFLPGGVVSGFPLLFLTN